MEYCPHITVSVILLFTFRISRVYSCRKNQIHEGNEKTFNSLYWSVVNGMYK